MSQITVSHTVDAPASRVWAALADFSGVHRFHPYVQKSPLLSEQNGGVGAMRRCDFYDGNHIVERVSAWNEGHSLKIDIVEGSMPLVRAQGEMAVEPIDEQRSRVHFKMDYTPKFGAVGKMMDALMMRRQFNKLAGEVLDGLQTHLQTGAIVGRGGQPERERSPAVA